MIKSDYRFFKTQTKEGLLQYLMEKAKLELLFSPIRLKSYQSLQEHFANLRLIGNIAPKLCVLEICIRNIVNDILIEKLGVDWCESENEAEYRGKNLCNHQLVSRQNLGFWCKMINKHKLHNHIFVFDKGFDLKKYDSHNTNKFYYNGKKRLLRESHKSEIILNWFHTIRNRAFHAENLLKTKVIMRDNKASFAPRITTFISIDDKYKLYFGVMPDKIETFLEDCLDLIDGDLKSFIGGVAQGATD